ncbi:hypothetical protein GGF32_007328, partial [Allomyces javanicus]
MEAVLAHESAQKIMEFRFPAKAVRPESAPRAGMIFGDDFILALAKKGVVLVMEEEDEEKDMDDK